MLERYLSRCSSDFPSPPSDVFTPAPRDAVLPTLGTVSVSNGSLDHSSQHWLNSFGPLADVSHRYDGDRGLLSTRNAWTCQCAL